MKRFIIIGAMLTGIKIATVARQLGVSRSWASREANAPRTRNIIAGILELRREQLEALFDRTLDVIDDAMNARKLSVVNCVLVDVGPDRGVRREAVDMFRRLMQHRAWG
ncbi:MAG: hypothetical protein ABI612_19580, partial [Betaproteobacteria bacterium]